VGPEGERPRPAFLRAGRVPRRRRRGALRGGRRRRARGAVFEGSPSLREGIVRPPGLRGFTAQAASGSTGPGGLTPSTPSGFQPARTSITRAEFLSLGDTAAHTVQVYVLIERGSARLVLAPHCAQSIVVCAGCTRRTSRACLVLRSSK